MTWGLASFSIFGATRRVDMKNRQVEGAKLSIGFRKV
jgi:hypothetical protein